MNSPAEQPVRLRRMRWWDVEHLLPVERELFGPTAWSAETFWSELAHPDTRWYLIAEDAESGDLLGYAGLLVSGGVGGPEGDVQTVAVAPAAQGRGVGRFLLRAVIAEAARRTVTSLLLEVRADNDAAVRLYRSEGFERVSVRRAYYQPGDVDAWILRLRPVLVADRAVPR